MKLLTKMISTFVLGSTLVGCGSQPQINQVMPSKNLKQAQQNQRVRSYYFLGQLESSTFRPDKNGHQFGFDHLSLDYKTFWPDDQQKLRVSYSVHPSNQHIMISHATKVGTPEQKWDHINETDTKKIQEINSFIRTLLTSNDEDKQNLDRVLAVFSKILGQHQLQTKRVRSNRR